MTSTFKTWFGGLLITALVVSISVVWLDKPIAILVYETFGPRNLPDAIAHSRGLSIPLACALIFVALGLSAILGPKFSGLGASIFMCDVSVLAADAIKNELKYAFGRTWPDSWEPGILSLIHDQVYGFNFFHSGPSYDSFPSGHAAVVAAVMSVLWVVYPKLRALYAICIGVADIGLVLLNLHFVSDVVAGTFVGLSTGLFTVVLCSRIFSSTQADTR